SSGADVAIVARGQEALDAAVAEIKKTAKGKVIGIAADVGTAQGVQRAYDGGIAAFGELDIAVNNAGTSATGPLEKLTDAVMQADQHVPAAKRKGVPIADYLAGLAKDVPLGRVGRAEEFANMACFLASDAGSYIIGTAINIDGGRSPVV